MLESYEVLFYNDLKFIWKKNISIYLKMYSQVFTEETEVQI